MVKWESDQIQEGNLEGNSKQGSSCKEFFVVENCEECQQIIHLLEYPIPPPPLSVTKKLGPQVKARLRVLLTERLNSNSRVAFDHQIVIIIIKSKKISKNKSQTKSLKKSKKS